MLSPVSFFAAPTPITRQYGPPAVEGASARAGRDGSGQTGPQAARRVPGQGADRSGPPLQIAGRSPSLSTDVIGTLGRLEGAALTRLDPLTGEPIEIDPITGLPVKTVAASLASGGTGGGTRDEVGPDGLTPEEQAEVRRLQAIDRQVRQHEAAHKAAGVGVTGPATFTYVTGPDGRQYAVAGEVGITVTASASTNPDQAVRQLEQVKRAALAPADPSPADRAAAAAAEAAKAQAEAALREQEEREEQQQERREQTATVSVASGDAFGAAAAAYGAAGALVPGRPASQGGADGLTPPQVVFSLIA